MQFFNLFTVAGDSGDQFTTDWVAFPKDYDELEYWVSCKMFNGSQINIVLESSMDMDQNTAQTLSTANVTATGTTVTSVTSSIGAYVRLRVSVSTAASQGIFSVWAVPKRS